MDSDGNKSVWVIIIVSALSIIGLFFLSCLPGWMDRTQSNTAQKMSALAASSTSSRGASSNSASSASSADSSSAASSSSTVTDDAIATQLNKAAFARKTTQVVTTVASGTTAQISLYTKGSNGRWTKTLATSGYVGSQGVGSAHEDLSRTPEGAYPLGFAFGRHSSSDVTTHLNYRQIDSRSYWIEDSNDPDYNTWQDRTRANSKNEHLIDYPTQYEYGIVIDYNTASPTPGAGSGFFLHVANGRPTAGCVSVPRSVILKLLADLKPGAYIVNVNSVAEIGRY